jgi:hypothetical protein
MSCCKTYDPCLDSKLNQIGSYASAARQSATSAAASEAAADADAAAAAASATQTNNYLTQVTNIFENFDERYLGSKSVPPTVDNQGNPLQEGAMYWNSVSNGLFIWDGSVWVALPTGFDEFTNFLATGTTTARNLVTRFADVVNVKDFGAVGDGVTDDTAAFSAAAIAAPALDTLGPPNNTSTIPRANTSSVFVPSGNYLLTSLVDVANKNTTWILASGAKITGSDFLNGKTVREGLKVTNGYPYGILDSPAGFNVTLGGEYSDKPAPIAGVSNPAALAEYDNFDGVALLGTAYSFPALADIATANYTSNTAVMPELSADQKKRLRRGMLIETKHATPYVGAVDSWVHSGGQTTITIEDGWYEYKNSIAGIQTPANGTGLLLSPVTKIWGGNFVVNLTQSGAARAGIGCEISYRNLLATSGDNPDAGLYRNWGYLSAAVAENTPSHFKSQAAFIARGWWNYGYVSDNQEIGLYYKTTSGSKLGIKTRMNFAGTVLLAEDTTNNTRYQIKGAGDTEHGDPAVTAPSGRTISFHTSGAGSAYDSQILATSGTATPGQGTLTYRAVNNIFGGLVRPSQDDVFQLGSASFRWSEVYAGVGTINTSDETLKEMISDIPEEWLNAWSEVKWKRFKFKDAIEKKGDNARWHVGVIAQQIEEAFNRHNINAFEIGLLCRDQIEETVTETYTATRPVFEEIDEEYTEEVIEEDKVILKFKTRKVSKAKEKKLPLVDEFGSPVLDDKGIQIFRNIPEMEEYEERQQVTKPTGKWRYGIRYSEAQALESAWLRREAAKNIIA